MLSSNKITSEIEVPTPEAEEQSFHTPVNLPLMPTEEPADEEESRNFWEQAHQFFQTSGSAGFEIDESVTQHKTPGSVISALLAPYEKMMGVSYDYPLWIAEGSEKVPDGLFMPVAELLRGAFDAFAPDPNQAKTLHDNLSRIEMSFRDAMNSTGQPESFRLILDSAFEKTRTQLALSGEESVNFEADLKQFSAKLPTSGTVTGFSGEATFYILAALLKAKHVAALSTFSNEIQQISTRLTEKLQVEHAKMPDEREPERLQQSLGFSSAYINSATLSEVLPDSSSVSMSPERQQRIRKILNILTNTENCFWEKDASLLIHEAWYKSSGFSWKDCFKDSIISSFKSGSGAVTASEMFEKQMESAAAFFAAFRIAKMEIDDLYRAEIHDVFFQHFDWKRMGTEELALVPPVFLIEDESSLTAKPQAISRLLLSAQPNNVLVLKKSVLQNSLKVRNALDPSDDDSFGFRQEMGLWAVSHRKAFVAQASVSHLEHLIQSIFAGIQAPLPSFLNVLSPKTDLERNDQTYLETGAAVESREFPLFTYDPNRGLEWGSRFLVSANPQPEQDWPVYEMEVTAEDGTVSSLSLAFTQADYMALTAASQFSFMHVPVRFWSEERMLPIPDYLRLTSKESQGKLPYFWTLDSAGLLQRVLVNLVLTESCRERLDAWAFVQDFGGTNNYHAKLAAAEARAKTLAETEQTIAELQKEHQAELNRVRKETAGEAMERLTSVLLDLDHATLIPSGGISSPATSVTDVTPDLLEDESAAVEEETDTVEEEIISEEAWLETFRCTTCNECTEMSPAMFEYNAEKQAVIKDVNAGTYKELVLAAEECPAKCIHPGQPLNPDEAGLEDLIKRAAVFN